MHEIIFPLPIPNPGITQIPRQVKGTMAARAMRIKACGISALGSCLGDLVTLGSCPEEKFMTPEKASSFNDSGISVVNTATCSAL